MSMTRLRSAAQPQTGNSRRSRTRWLSIAILVARALGAPSVSAAQQATPRPVRTTATVHEGSGLVAVLSPDDRKVALLLLGSVFVLDRATGSAIPLRSPKDDPSSFSALAWSPDSRRLVLLPDAYNPSGTILVDLARGTRTRLTTRADFPALRWAPQSHILVTVPLGDSVEVRQYELEGDRVTRLAMLPRGSAAPSLAPDGRSIVYATSSTGSGVPTAASTLRELNLETGTTRDVTHSGGWDALPLYSPDGNQIAFVSHRSAAREVWVASRDGSDAHAITSGTDDLQLTPLSWTSDSRSIMYVAQGRVYLVPVQGGPSVEVPFAATFPVTRWTGMREPNIPKPGERRVARGIGDPELSPDGRSVVYSALGDLWIASLDGSAPRRITDTPMESEWVPRWSRDGLRIAFMGQHAGANPALHVFDVANRADRLYASNDAPVAIAWSPDGRRVAAYRGNRLLWLNVADGQWHTVASIRAPISSLAGWSATSDTILVSTAAIPPDSTGAPVTSHRFLRVAVADSANPMAWSVPDSVGPLNGAWSWDQSHVAFTRGGVGFVSSTGGRQLTRLADAQPHSLSWSADGRALSYMANGQLRILDLDRGTATTRSIAPSLVVAPSPSPLLIRGARIIDGRGAPPTPPRDVLVQSGHIARIGPSGTLKAPMGARTINASGKTLLPGLFDLHVHLGEGFPSPEFLYYGVLSVRDVGSDGERTEGMRERAWAGVAPSPNVFLSASQLTAAYELGNRSPAARIEAENTLQSVTSSVSSLIASGADVLKVYFRNDGFDALASDAAHALGLPMTSHFLTPGAIARGLEGKEHSRLYVPEGGRSLARRCSRAGEGGGHLRHADTGRVCPMADPRSFERVSSRHDVC